MFGQNWEQNLGGKDCYTWISALKGKKIQPFFTTTIFKNMCHWGWTQRSLTIKKKHKMK
jgi:hypothetical protein